MKFDIRIGHIKIRDVDRADVAWEIENYADWLYGDYETETGESAINESGNESPEFADWLYDEATALHTELVQACEDEVIDFHDIEIKCVDDTWDYE